MIKVFVENGCYKPEKAHREDAGFDLRTPISFEVQANGSFIVDTGVHVEIPYGYVGMLKSKSGLNVKHNLVSEGVVDCGYSGSIRVKIYNHSVMPYEFKKGDKITQLVIIPISEVNNLIEVDSLDDFEICDRGNNGFGSTGK